MRRFLRMDAARRLSIEGPNNILAPSFTFFRSLMSSLLPQVTPPMVSLLPLMNLVKLCNTMSAPKAAGEMDNGEKVLSTNNFNPFDLAICESSGRLAISNNGLLTLSQ